MTNKTKWVLEILFRLVVGIFILFGVITKFPQGLILLIISGLLSGLYYGHNDDNLWGGGRKNKITHYDPVKYNMHLYWIHILCGIVAAISLYLLSAKFNLINPTLTLRRLKIDDVILFTISLLGYMGLLPRTFWFIANTGKIKT